MTGAGRKLCNRRAKYKILLKSLLVCASLTFVLPKRPYISKNTIPVYLQSLPLEVQDWK